MRDAIHEAITEHRPAALVIDLSGFDYYLGDWIGVVSLTALRTLGRGRVCVLTTGKTATAVRELFEVTNVGQ